MEIRKSNRNKVYTAKAREMSTAVTNQRSGMHSSGPQLKKRKVDLNKEEEKSDKIDPVEKLLSLSNFNNDILTNLDEELNFDEYCGDSTPTLYSDNRLISLNFTKILNDSLRSYYSKKRNPMEIYNDNSSFAILNKGPNNENVNDKGDGEHNINSSSLPTTPNVEVPLFKNVNFNSDQLSSYTLDQCFAYDDLVSEEEAEADHCKEIKIDSQDPKSRVTPKMNFKYRQNNNLNLSSGMGDNLQQQDVFKILNQRSILTGRASEMISTGNFLINDFFL